MTDGRRGEDDLPIFDAPEPTPVGRRDAGIQTAPSHLGPARGAGLAAAAIALLVVGIAVGSFSLQGDPTDSAGPFQSGATPSGSLSDEACSAPQSGEFPKLSLAAEGTARAVQGKFWWGASGATARGIDWAALPVSSALAVAPLSNLVLGTSPELVVGANPNVTAADPSLNVGPVLHACFRHVEVRYRATEPRLARDPGTVLLSADLEPVTGRVVLGGLPAGDWIVWVTATFETYTRSFTEVATGTSFRVLSGNGPFASDSPSTSPGPTPLATPAAPCGTSAATPTIAVRLFIGPDAAGPGVPGLATEPTEVHVRIGDRLVIRVDGDVCAIGWDISQTVTGGEGQRLEFVSNPNEDPEYAAQNRWDIPPTYGSGTLTAVLHFSGGLQVVRSWSVILDPFEIPALYVVGPDGTRFEATAGCGLSLELSNGYQASADCGSIGYSPGNRVLYVQAFQPIHLDLPGWDITGWGAACGRVTGDPEQFESPSGCGLGSGTSEEGVPLTDRPAFVLPAGDTILQVFITAIDGAGNRFSVTYYARVIAR